MAEDFVPQKFTLTLTYDPDIDMVSLVKADPSVKISFQDVERALWLAFRWAIAQQAAGGTAPRAQS